MARYTRSREVVRRVFVDGGFDSRCSFVGKDGMSTTKADFAIPSKNDPRIVIESKGYAATASKQTDVIGDIQKIISAKRHDSALLLVTDGLTWRRRINDLRTIVQMQNRGEVARIYTSAMVERYGGRPPNPEIRARHLALSPHVHSWRWRREPYRTVHPAAAHGLINVYYLRVALRPQAHQLDVGREQFVVGACWCSTSSMVFCVPITSRRYSVLSATIGSTRLARSAGMQTARIATPARRIVPVENVSMSVGATPNSWPRSSRVAAKDAASPITTATATIRIPSSTTSRTIWRD